MINWILPSGAIQYQHHLNGARWGDLRHHASDLGEFVHQPTPRLHAAGGVDNHWAVITRRGQSERIVNCGCGVPERADQESGRAKTEELRGTADS